MAEAEQGPAGKRMPEDIEFLRAQAEKCRWLAKRISANDVAETLLQMARDYDARADGLAKEPDAP